MPPPKSGYRAGMDLLTAHKTWRTLEPIHAMVYFAPQPIAKYTALGVTEPRMGYFASRSAALGAAGAHQVIATFYNFNPVLVRKSIPAAWQVASPQQFLDARLSGVDAALRSVWSDEMLASPEFKQVVKLLRRAAEVACEHSEGRALFAAHADVPWPNEAHLVAWHAQTLLREFRGDGHIAMLIAEGLSGVEALITHAASGAIPAETLQNSRAWSDDEWAAGVSGLQTRGLLQHGATLAFSEQGKQMRDRIEAQTDALSMAPYAALGAEACDQLRAIGRPFSKAVVDGGLLGTAASRFSQE